MVLSVSTTRLHQARRRSIHDGFLSGSSPENKGGFGSSSVGRKLLSLRFLDAIGGGDLGGVGGQGAVSRGGGGGGRERQEGDGFDSQEAGEGEGIGGAQDWSVGQAAHRCQGCGRGRCRGSSLGEAHVEVYRGRHGGGLGSGFGGL